jgi:hypothetical protein
MKTAWKFILQPKTTVEIPDGAKILHVAQQGDHLCMWALVDPEQPKVKRYFSVYGTGFDMPDDPGEFIGTALMNGGSLVFHIFEEV